MPTSAEQKKNKNNSNSVKIPKGFSMIEGERRAKKIRLQTLGDDQVPFFIKTQIGLETFSTFLQFQIEYFLHSET